MQQQGQQQGQEQGLVQEQAQAQAQAQVEVSTQQEKSGTLPVVEIWALDIPAEDEDEDEGENKDRTAMDYEVSTRGLGRDDEDHD